MIAVSNNLNIDSSVSVSHMSGTLHRGDEPYHRDEVSMIVHSLMCYRQSGESKEFARRSIESLVRKLKERGSDIEALMTAITSNGAQPCKCVTIPRTLDGRMQIAGRKCLPHVIYAKIWRWPDLLRNELRHNKLCAYGFEMRHDSVCVNPYHYDRIVSSVDIAALSLSPVEHESAGQYMQDDSDNDSGLPDTTTGSSIINGCSTMKSQSTTLLETRVEEDQNRVSSTSCHGLSVRVLADDSESISTTIYNDGSSSSSSLRTPVDDGLGATLTTLSGSSSAFNFSTDRINPTPYLDRGQNTMAWSGVAASTLYQTNITSDPPHPSSIRSAGHINSYMDSSNITATTRPSNVKDPQVSVLTDRPPASDSAEFMLATKNNILAHNFSICSKANGVIDCTRCTVATDGNGDGSAGNARNATGSGYSGATSCSGTGGGALCGSGSVGVPGGDGSGNGSNWPSRGPGGGHPPPPPPPFAPSGSLLQPLPVLTTQRPPEFWCHIAYFELDQQVGELFKVPSRFTRVTVDGYTDPSSPNRFCLGQLSNVHRSEQSEKSRLYIGKGVELDNVGEGDVWIRCLSEFSVFVQSYYLDREAGRRPGDAVHKIYPGAYIKVFDIRQCHEQMKLLAHSAQVAAEHQAAVVVGSISSPASSSGGISQHMLSHLPPGPSPSNTMQGGGTAGSGGVSASSSLSGSGAGGSSLAAAQFATANVGVDDLRRLCMLRLSFVKGWGPDYPRRGIKETPCWIEIQLHRPLQLLDEVLQGMPLNDRKPTRYFFSCFPQPPQTTSCVTTSRPQQLARRT